MINLDEFEVDPLASYGGADGGKLGIVVDGTRYMVKIASKKPVRGELTYINGCYSEHVSCTVLRSIGLNAQETMLGTLTVRGKERVVVACKDFTDEDTNLADFASLRNRCIESSQEGYGTDLKEIEATIEEQQWVPQEELEGFFWNMFIGDALVANFDRHNGNWGFLVNRRAGTVRIAPIFDCGSCLFPQLPIESYRDVLNNPEEIRSRVYTYPSSALKMNGRKINYFEFISSMSSEECLEALKRLAPRIREDVITSAVEGCDGLSDIQREFYTTILLERKKCLIDGPFEIRSARCAPRARHTRSRGPCTFPARSRQA